MYFKTEKSLRIGIMVIVALLSLASVLLYFARPDNAQMRIAGASRSPALPISPAVEQPKVAPVTEGEFAPEVEESSPRMMGPLEALPYQLLMGLDDREAEEDKRWVIRNAVKAETVAETIYQLSVTPFNKLFSPALVSLWHNPPSNSSLCYEEMLKDPRVRKLHDIAVSGTPEERAYLFDELLVLAEENGGLHPEGVGVVARMSPHESMLGALPPLLAEAGEPAESLAVMAEITRAMLGSDDETTDQETRRDRFLSSIAYTFTGNTLPMSYSMDRTLSRALAAGTIKPGDGEALADYASQRSAMEQYIHRNSSSLDSGTLEAFGVKNYTQIKEQPRTLDEMNRIIMAMVYSGLRTAEPVPPFEAYHTASILLDALLEAAEIQGN